MEEVQLSCGSDVNGSLQNKNHFEKCSYLLLWVGENGRDIINMWVLTEDEEKEVKLKDIMSALRAIRKVCYGAKVVGEVLWLALV